MPASSYSSFSITKHNCDKISKHFKIRIKAREILRSSIKCSTVHYLFTEISSLFNIHNVQFPLGDQPSLFNLFLHSLHTLQFFLVVDFSFSFPVFFRFNLFHITAVRGLLAAVISLLLEIFLLFYSFARFVRKILLLFCYCFNCEKVESLYQYFFVAGKFADLLPTEHIFHGEKIEKLIVKQQ